MRLVTAWDRLELPTPPDGGHRGEAERCVAALADRLLVAHAAPGSKTERLCRDALAAGKRVFTLESSDNAHLIARGAVPVAADDPTACVGDELDGPA